jgi:alkaline phosphatase D
VHRPTRREALAAGLGALLLPSSARAVPVSRRPVLRGGAFRHGVAAGVPSTSGTTLWTRVSDIERSGRLTLEVARDAGFSRVVQRKDVAAVSWRDFTARAVVDGLPPGEEWFYRFATRGASSPVGRFRTLRPADSQEPIRVGFFSCQKYTTGFWPAHAALAQEDLDLVVSLGDYIYETGGRSGVRPDLTGTNKDGRVETLGEYREKYGLYRADPDLQAMHAAHAFAATWDDHELENDYAGASSPSRARRIPYEERKRQAYLAFFEWMPRFRLAEERSRVYGSVPLGGLAELLLIDTRQYRDPPPCGGAQGPCAEPDPGRTFLGAAQKAWLKERLVASRAAWKLLGNQTMMMGLEAPPGSSLNPDQWDGYPREREEVLQHVLRNGVKDLAVLTGDIHAFFAGDVHPGGNALSGPAAATEFVGGSISSGGFEEEVGEPGARAIAAGARANNPHIKDVELTKRGYGVLEARPGELLVTFKAVPTVSRRGVPAATLARYRVPRGEARVEVLQASS